MTCFSRRGLITAASVGVAGPLIVEEGAAGAGRAVIATSKVPIGGGVVVSARGVVVTQPFTNRFRVFSATCTHTGCLVSRVAERRINCPCHGSQFAIGDGSVITGPAPAPLRRRAFTIRDGKIFLT